ncbi:MAG: type II CRISPR-associated endonuclease Cas1 [Proteobacteria bacterium]|nr:type II CRISPR-associated endonuclease Cas1 [Pseudomonadota bacterium]
MPEQRVLAISNPATLRIDTGRLKIEREGYEPVFVSPKDIAVLCLEHHTVTLSVAVLRTLAEAGAAIIVTDTRHLPCAMQLPLAATGLDTGRLRQQIAFDTNEKRGVLWQQLVSAKLLNQAYALRLLKRNGALRLERLASQVQPGDKSNTEGQGSKHYWGNLFPETFKRSKEGAEDPLNIRLNYGYAVLRAMIARTLVSVGLNGALGLGHSNAANAFNLADDFIEPYRFMVDIQVADDADAWSEVPEFDSRAKRHLLGFIEHTVRMDGKEVRLHAAIDASIASYVRILDGKDHRLLLPEGAALTKDKRAWELMDGA